VCVWLEHLLTKTAALLGVPRATVPAVMSACTYHEKATSTKRNSGCNSTLIERDRAYIWGMFRIITDELQQNRIFISKTLFKQKLSDVSFTCPTSVVGRQLLNFWLLRALLRCVKDGVTTIKPGHRTTGNALVIWSDESSFTLFPTSGRVYVWRTPKEAYNPEYLVSTTKHGAWWGLLWWFGQQHRGTVFCWSHCYPSWPNYCKGVRG
jgi:hypothetical protein